MKSVFSVSTVVKDSVIRMKVKEALVLLGVLSSSVATIVSQQCWYDVYVINKAEPVCNLGRSCLCPPRHGFQVSQSIKEANADLERVVVFFYRDRANNNVYMFTPSKEKQLTIPELTFGKDDDLYKVINDLSVRPFESTTTTVNIDVHHSPQTSNNHQYPLKKITNAQDPNIVKIDSSNAWYDQTKWPDAPTIDYTPGSWYNHKNEKGKVKKDHANWFDPKEQEMDDNNLPNGRYDPKNMQNIITIDHSNLFGLDDEEKDANSEYSPNGLNDLKNQSNIVPIDHQEEEENVSNVEFSHNDLFDDKIDGNMVTIDHPNFYVPNNEQNLIMTHTTNSSYEPLRLIKTEQNDKDVISSFEQESEINTYEQSGLDNGAAQVPNSNNFKHWYSHQVQQFSELVSNDSRHISIDEIEGHVVNLLNSNGYSVKDNQVLNANDESIDLSNYKLIRVIIRAPDDEQRLSSNVIGVMLVNMSPLTILGVVPLKNTFDETNIQSKDRDIHLLAENEYPFISRGSKKSEELRINDTALEKEASKSSNMKNLLSNLSSMLHRIIPSRQAFDNTRRDSGEDVLPGFRIIGGNPATGSGTPIASKGRSASP